MCLSLAILTLLETLEQICSLIERIKTKEKQRKEKKMENESEKRKSEREREKEGPQVR